VIKRITAILCMALMTISLNAIPAGAEEIFDCEGNIALACPGPVPW
jgi:hypothetical protein